MWMRLPFRAGALQGSCSSVWRATQCASRSCCGSLVLTYSAWHSNGPLSHTVMSFQRSIMASHYGLPEKVVRDFSFNRIKNSFKNFRFRHSLCNSIYCSKMRSSWKKLSHLLLYLKYIIKMPMFQCKSRKYSKKKFSAAYLSQIQDQWVLSRNDRVKKIKSVHLPKLNYLFVMVKGFIVTTIASLLFKH